LQAPDFNPCVYEARNWFQAFVFKCNLYRYTLARHRAIVTRLSAAQDLAAMDVLLCDKTAGLHK
jgi:hypothetical protein